MLAPKPSAGATSLLAEHCGYGAKDLARVKNLEIEM
jgi:hypothetical protein